MEFLTTLAHVQRGLWLPSLESLPNPATGHCLTQPLAKGRDSSLLPTLSGYVHLMAEDSISPTQVHELN